MKRTYRPRARRRAGIVLSETHRSGMRALRLSESTDEPIYTYNLHSRTRDPAEVRAASRDEMPELPEYIVSRIRHARDEGAAAHRQDSSRGEGACAGNDDSQTRIPVPADMYAPLPEEEPPRANGKAVRSGSKSAQSRLSTSKPAPLPADKEPPRAKTASKASTAKSPRAKPAARGRKAAALSDDLPDLPDDVFRDMRSARDDIASADESVHLPDSDSVYAAPEPLLSGDCTFELTADEIAAALSGARAEGISAELARELRFALASPADVDWGKLKYDYCEICALRALARLISGPKRALIGCLAGVQARRAIAQACALEDVMHAAGDVLSSAAFIKPEGIQAEELYVWERLMGEAGVLRGALRACAARERAEYVNVRNVCDRLLVPGMPCSLNLNAFRYMLCDIYADACRAASVKARVPNADCVMEWFERALPALRVLARWRAVMRGETARTAADGALL